MLYPGHPVPKWGEVIIPALGDNRKGGNRRFGLHIAGSAPCLSFPIDKLQIKNISYRRGVKDTAWGPDPACGTMSSFPWYGPVWDPQMLDPAPTLAGVGQVPHAARVPEQALRVVQSQTSLSRRWMQHAGQGGKKRLPVVPMQTMEATLQRESVLGHSSGS